MAKQSKLPILSTIGLANVSKAFMQAGNRLAVLDHLSYTFAKGHTYAIIGASGSGKSTLLHLIAGLDTPSEGTIEYNTIAQPALNKHFGVMLQHPFLISELTVLENVMLKGLSAGRKRHECQQQAAALLSRVGLADQRDCQPAMLSGGQQQRVALARALFGTPDFILADEPTGNLDDRTGTSVIDAVLEQRTAYGIGIIVSTHDHAVAQRMDTILELHEGRLRKIHV